MRRVFFIAAAATALVTTSFTAQEPPLAPINAAPPAPSVEYGPMSGLIRLEFRPGKDKADHRIVWKDEGVEIEAVRFSIEVGSAPMVVVATADGMQVQARGLTTVCKSIDIRPAQLGADPRGLPSAKSSGQFHIARSTPGQATLTCGNFRIECTKLMLSGEKNRFEVIPGPKSLQVRTRDAELRAAGASVSYETGFRLTINARTAREGDDAAGERIDLTDPR